MLTEILDNKKVVEASRYIGQAKRIVILTHMAPDGDAMGSSLAMYHYLRQNGKEAHVIVPTAFPDFLRWMPGAAEIIIYEKMAENALEKMDAADLIVCTDFNEPKRMGVLGDKLLALKKEKTSLRVIMIDHHLFPSDIADVVLSYPQTPSASELVYRLLTQLGEIGIDSATCIYTGMMTDTGNFSFNSNYCDMYQIVHDLVKMGVDKDAVYDQVMNSHTADRMRLVGYCLYQKMRIFPQEHTALIYLNRKELYRFNFRSGDAEGLVNIPMQIKDIYYSCFMREDKVNASEEMLAGGSKTKIKISMRSKGDRPVNTFCHDVFGGGGHKNASGGEYYGPLENAVQLFLDNYKKYNT